MNEYKILGQDLIMNVKKRIKIYHLATEARKCIEQDAANDILDEIIKLTKVNNG